MKNLFNISLMVLIVGTISACSGTRDATAVSTGDTTITSPSASNSVSTGLTAPVKNLNTPDQPTGMASGNSQASLIDTIAADVFLQQAAALGAKKMELGKIAEAKGQSAEVKSFAKSIVEDHAKVTTELQSLAKSKNIELLNNGADIKVDADKLQAISAASFDNSYTAIMIADHDKAVQLFESAAKSSDKEVSAYAKKYLPTLRAHLTKAGDLNKK